MFAQTRLEGLQGESVLFGVLLGMFCVVFIWYILQLLNCEGGNYDDLPQEEDEVALTPKQRRSQRIINDRDDLFT